MSRMYYKEMSEDMWHDDEYLFVKEYVLRRASLIENFDAVAAAQKGRGVFRVLRDIAEGSRK